MENIKKALENEIKQLEEDWRFAGFRRPIEDRIVALRTALSELEGSKPKRVTGITLQGEQSDPAGTITVLVDYSDGSTEEVIRTCANSIYHWIAIPTERPKEQGAEPAPTSREKAMEEAINNANVSIQRLDHRDLDMHKVAMMDVDDWRAIQDAAKSTK